MSGYSYPQLSTDEIVPYLKEFNIRIEDVDFKRPDPSRWQDIYSQLVELLTDVPFDVVLQQPLYNTDMFEYPDLHQDSLPMMLLTVSLQRLLCACGITNFSLRDIREPRTPRLLKICSAIINFVRFRDTRMQVFYELKEENEKYREQHEHHLKLNEELRRRVENIKAQRAEQEPEVLKVQQDIEVLAVRMQELHKIQCDKQKSINEIKTKIAEKKASNDHLKVNICRIKEEGEKLSQKIVQSPERVKEEQEGMRQHLGNLKLTLETKRENLDKLRQQLEKIQQHATNTEKALKMLHSVKVDIEKEDEISKEIALIIDKKVELKNTLRDMQGKKEQLQQLLSNRQDKLAKLSLQHQNRMKSAVETHKQLKEEKENAMQRLGKDESRKNELEVQKQRLVDLLMAKQKALDEKICQIRNVYSEIIAKIDDYHLGLGVGWKEFRQVMQ